MCVNLPKAALVSGRTRADGRTHLSSKRRPFEDTTRGRSWPKLPSECAVVERGKHSLYDEHEQPLTCFASAVQTQELEFYGSAEARETREAREAQLQTAVIFKFREMGVIVNMKTSVKEMVIS